MTHSRIGRGAITDVPGVRVGHADRRSGGWLTGVTVVLPPPGSRGSVDVRGGGPGTHETDALDPTTMVPTVDAVALTGGSAYGLVAAHGVQRWCEQAGRGFPVDGGVVPIVPAAAIFDLGRGGDFAARPDEDMGYWAAADAVADRGDQAFRRGNIGAGTGALVAGQRYKGGVGSASIHLGAGHADDGEQAGADGGLVVGALAVVNALGAPRTGPGAHDAEDRFTRPGSPPDAPAPGATTPNTTLVVIATNAILDPAQCRRTATAGHAGLPRALDPVHTLADGDTVFTLATGDVALPEDPQDAVAALIRLQGAAASVVESAINDAVATADPVATEAGCWPRWEPISHRRPGGVK